METFIKSSTVKSKKEKVDKAKIEKFIQKFNAAIKKGEMDFTDTFVLNNSLDKVPTLNDAELEFAAKMAEKEGWDLRQAEDNYQSTSYYLKKI